MKAGEVIEQLVKSLSQNKPVDKPESFVRYQLKIDINPKDKAFAIFLLNLVNVELESPYSDIRAIVGNGMFDYQFDGNDNEIILELNSFYKHGGNLKKYYSLFLFKHILDGFEIKFLTQW